MIVSVMLVVAVSPIGVAVSTLLLLAAVHAGVIPLIAARRLTIPGRALVSSLGGGAALGLVVVAVVGLVPADGPAWLLARGTIAVGAIVAVLVLDPADNEVTGRSFATAVGRYSQPWLT